MKQEQNIPLEEQHSVHNGEVHASQSQQQKPVTRRVFRCANCDIEFFWPPMVVHSKVYCCSGCAAGGPCNCDYSLYRSVTIMGVIYYEQ